MGGLLIMSKLTQRAMYVVLLALLALIIAEPPAHSGYLPTPTGTGWVTVTGSKQDVAAKAFPTGTGFLHSTSGVIDSATLGISLTSSEVTGTLPVSKGGTSLASLGADGTFIGSNGSTMGNRYVADPFDDGMRLTCSSGVAVPTADVTAATTIYLTTYKSRVLSLYDGAGWAKRYPSSDPSLALSGLASGKNYDVFAYWTGLVVSLELSTVWTSDTARATALGSQDGVPVKSGDSTRRYIGTIRTTSTTTTEDSVSRRFVWNQWNQVPRQMAVFSTTGSTYTGVAGWRISQGLSTNFVSYVTGDAATVVTAASKNTASSATSGLEYASGVGIDSTSASSAQISGNYTFASVTSPDYAYYVGTPGIGYHAINWLEYAQSTSVSFVSTSAVRRAGLTASIVN